MLVRHHLLLPEVATRRDLEDPATVALVAETVGNDTTLELLRALAAADGEATGPAAWTPWKARLVDDLVQRASAVLEGRPVPAGPPVSLPRATAVDGGRGLPGPARASASSSWSPPTGPGCSAMWRERWPCTASACSRPAPTVNTGTPFDVFVLDLARHADPRWERVVADIEAAVEAHSTSPRRWPDGRPPAGARAVLSRWPPRACG